MQEIMTVDSMKDYMRAAGQYAARIASLTQEIQELVGDTLPHYSGWHVSGARGGTGASKVEQAVTLAEKNRSKAARLMKEVLRMKRELDFLDSLYYWGWCNVVRLHYFYGLRWPEIARRVHRCESTCRRYEQEQLEMLCGEWNEVMRKQSGLARAAVVQWGGTKSPADCTVFTKLFGEFVISQWVGRQSRRPLHQVYKCLHFCRRLLKYETGGGCV